MKELDELIGEPDIIITITMAKNGMQIKLATDEKTEKFTATWDEILD